MSISHLEAWQSVHTLASAIASTRAERPSVGFQKWCYFFILRVSIVVDLRGQY
jgi:hypothetical protein